MMFLMFFNLKKKRIYLDFAAATPVKAVVLASMKPYFSSVFGNAGAIHAEGVAAQKALETAREELATLLHVRKDGVVFTGSGTESNNLAILGVINARLKKGVAYADMEIVSTKVEHSSVLEMLHYVSTLGVRVVSVPVAEDGLINLKEFEASLSDKTVLVTFAYANSETGVVQPVRALSRIAKAAQAKFGTQIYVHLDGAQAPLWLPCELEALGADLLSLDAGKCYGPKGVGALLFKHKVELEGIFYTGSQEGGLRAGTENIPLIVGAVKAFSIAQEERIKRSEKVTQLRDEFIKMLEKIEGVVVNGSKKDRIANNVNISIPGIDSEFAVICLDEQGIACATKSACGGARGDGSAVVREMTGDSARAHSTIRFTLGEETTYAHVSKTVKVLKAHVIDMRRALHI